MEPKKQYVIGMDCGTTNIKAILIGEEGRILADASRPSEPLNPAQGQQEQDANKWWKDACAIFKEIAEKAGEEIVSKIAGICISSHTVSMLPVDANGDPVRNAMTYQDSRSAQELDAILDTVGLERFCRIIGGRPAVAFLPNKIWWFKKYEPELFAKTKYIMQASSFINMKLTGAVTTDLDQASRTQCMDISTLQWSKEIGDVIGVDLDEMLPPIKAVDEIIGTVTEEAAAQTGLKAGIPVLAGCSDAMAALYATGMSRIGEAGESSGTSSLVFVGSRVQSAPDVPVVTKPCSIEGMPWIFDAPITSTGVTLKWFISLYAHEEVEYCEKNGLNIFDYLNELALESKAGAEGVFFYPYLMGERAPLWIDYPKGMFIGLTPRTKRADLIRAIFEGTAYAIRHVVETVKESGGEIEMLRICGGGAKSPTWNKIKASMLNVPVYVMDENSGDVPVGDALIAGAKAGLFEDLPKAVEKIVKVKEVVMPDPEWTAHYDRLYPYYVKMYQHLDPTLKSLDRTVRELF